MPYGTLVLRRIASGDVATYGILADDEDRQLAVTLERPRGRCLPAGEYHLQKVHGHANGAPMVAPHDVYEIERGDPATNGYHSALEVGNFADDCVDEDILLGLDYAMYEGAPGLRGSQRAYEALMWAMQDYAATRLVVVDPVPGFV